MKYTEEQYLEFVKHIQNNLVDGDTGLKLGKLRDKPLEVGCAICGKTIDEICYEEDKIHEQWKKDVLKGAKNMLISHGEWLASVAEKSKFDLTMGKFIFDPVYIKHKDGTLEILEFSIIANPDYKESKMGAEFDNWINDYCKKVKDYNESIGRITYG